MLWKKFDGIIDSRAYLELDDKCFYARDFISGGGFGASSDNNIISNFKKSVTRKGKRDWKYKVEAVRQFVQDLLTILPDNSVVAAVPSSKVRSHAEYDPRLDETLRQLVALNPSIRIEEPIVRTATVQALHQGGSRRIEEVLQSLGWVGFSEPPHGIVLIDDVITSGSTFKACQRLIHQHHPRLAVYGVFWARTIWPAPAPNDADE